MFASVFPDQTLCCWTGWSSQWGWLQRRSSLES
jgi:hypothetical protein